ncbi:MAG TPA: redoxin domain-containing protein [Pirellulales bacterium]|nr:redoxin domain-containing protein [Pirellulales bacterium]
MVPVGKLAIVIGIMFVAVANCVANEVAGIGAALAKDRDGIYIRALLPDTPASASGALHVGDRVLAVAEATKAAVETKDLKLEECVSLIRGGAGTTVRLTVVTAGKDESQARVVSVVRGDIKELSRWGDGQRIAAGAAAPDAPFVRLDDGKPERINDRRGQVVVITFWATWCGPCQKHMAHLQALATSNRQWKDRVTIIAASADDDEKTARDHAEQAGWDQTRNVWAAPEAIKAWHVASLPTTYIITPQGKIADLDEAADLADAVNRLLAE